MKALATKKEENQMNVKAKEAEQQVETIKKTTAEQIDQRRKMFLEEYKKKIQDAHLRENKLKQELKIVRIEMADEIKKAYKKGSNENCETAMKSSDDRDKYCIANFSEKADFEMLNQCRNSDQFCNLCCENEYGDMNSTERLTCKSSVCLKSQTSTVTPNPFSNLQPVTYTWQPK
jgi:hypothetical protein